MKPVRLAAGVVGIAAAAGLGLWLGRGGETAGSELVMAGNVDIRQVQLAFYGSERIASVRVQEGDHVRKGQILASLEKPRLEAAAADREARVEAQREVVRRMEAGSRPEEIRKARADLEAAAADQRNAELTAERVFRLAAQGASTPQASDDARAALDVAAARKAAAQEALALMVARAPPGGHRVRQGDAARFRGRAGRWPAATWPTPISPRPQTASSRIASWSRATWLRRRSRS